MNAVAQVLCGIDATDLVASRVELGKNFASPLESNHSRRRDLVDLAALRICAVNGRAFNIGISSYGASKYTPAAEGFSAGCADAYSFSGTVRSALGLPSLDTTRCVLPSGIVGVATPVMAANDLTASTPSLIAGTIGLAASAGKVLGADTSSAFGSLDTAQYAFGFSSSVGSKYASPAGIIGVTTPVLAVNHLTASTHLLSAGTMNLAASAGAVFRADTSGAYGFSGNACSAFVLSSLEATKYDSSAGIIGATAPLMAVRYLTASTPSLVAGTISLATSIAALFGADSSKVYGFSGTSSSALGLSSLGATGYVSPTGIVGVTSPISATNYLTASMPSLMAGTINLAVGVTGIFGADTSSAFGSSIITRSALDLSSLGAMRYTTLTDVTGLFAKSVSVTFELGHLHSSALIGASGIAFSPPYRAGVYLTTGKMMAISADVSVANQGDDTQVLLTAGHSFVGCNSVVAFQQFCGDLKALGEHLEDTIIGGISALITRRNDWIRVAAHQGREVLNQALRLMVPDADFSLREIEENEGEITRPMRVAKRLQSRGETVDQTQKFKKEVSEIVRRLNRLSHRDTRFTDADSLEILDLYKRVYGLLSVLF